MDTHRHFDSDFEVSFADLPARPDFEFRAEGSGARCIVVAVQRGGQPLWTATFAAPDPGQRTVSALTATPSPTGLCVIERGTAFLGDVLRPDGFGVMPTAGPVVAIAEFPTEAVLLLLTPWTITGIDAEGMRWSSPRIAVEEIRIDGVSDGWASGVTDPGDDESRDFSISLATGQVVGVAPLD